MTSKLNLTLLGGSDIYIDDQPLTKLSSRKAQALLFYLATNKRFYSRAALASLLWPDVPSSNARLNLRKEITQLRKTVNAYLLIENDKVAINCEANLWIDSDDFQGLIDSASNGSSSIAELTAAVDLYQGDFLEGFYVLNAPSFEEWVLLQRGRLRDGVLYALETLTDAYSQAGDQRKSIETIQKLLALEPWREKAQRKLMRLYAQSNQRGLALAQYETCCRVLRQELDVVASPETIALVEAIQRGEFKSFEQNHRNQNDGEQNSVTQNGVTQNGVTQNGVTQNGVVTDDSKEDVINHRRSGVSSGRAEATRPSPVLPPFLTASHRHRLSIEPFAGRQRQLKELQLCLDKALDGEGQIVFVTGEAGSGKTALVTEFVRRSLDQQANVVPIHGYCNAYNDVSDPFLPFREIVRRLTGDIESQWMTGSMTRANALRIWNLLPTAVRFLTDAGTDLLDTFVPSAALLRRADTYLADAPELGEALHRWASHTQTAERRTRAEQSHILATTTEFFATLAAQQPLILVLEDLHWADVATTSLLFHLVRWMRSAKSGARILIVGTYRPEDVVLGSRFSRDTQHPLAGVVHEFKRDFGDIWLRLDQTEEAENRCFMNTLIDIEPNRLDSSFRQTLFEQTHGHALFTVELLRSMRARGDLMRDEGGYWVEGEQLAWHMLPSRIEGVIEKRIGLLDEAQYDLLKIASVEGEEFTAQVLAQISESSERQIYQQLSQTLEKRHQLVHESAEEQIGGRRLSRYKFGHALIRQYIYDSISAGEKRLLQAEIGAALEALYSDKLEDMVVPLAHHFLQAEEWSKAFTYLIRSGERARQSYANQEALTFYTRALEVSQQIHPPLDPTAYLAIYEGRALVYLLLTEYEPAVANFKQMAEIAHQAGNLQKEGEALCQLAYIYWLTFSAKNTPHVANYASQAYRLAEQTGDQRILAQSLIHLGSVDQVHGDLREADKKFAQALAISRQEDHQESLGHSLVFSCMQAYLQGNYPPAIRFGEESVRVLGEINDAFTELRAVAFLCQSHWGAGQYRQALALLEDGLTKGRERENTFIVGRLLNTQGWFYRELGDAKQAAEFNQQSIELGRSASISNIEISGLINLGLDYTVMGQFEAALSTLQPTLMRVQEKAFGAHKWRWTMKLLIGLAEVNFRTGHYDEALTLVDAGIKEAKATFSQKYVAQGLALRGQIALTRNRHAQGGRDLRAAAAIAEALHSPTLLYPIAHELIAWHTAHGTADQAARYCQLAQDAVEQMQAGLGDEAQSRRFIGT